MVDENVEEMIDGWDIDKKYKYLCFYHKAFPFMKDSWGMDCADTKKEILRKERPLFSLLDVYEYLVCDEIFPLVINVMATDPQRVLCCDGECTIYRYPSRCGWVATPISFTQALWKKLAGMYRASVRDGYRLHRANMIALDDEQFKTAQHLIREVFGGEIDTYDIRKEF